MHDHMNGVPQCGCGCVSVCASFSTIGFKQRVLHIARFFERGKRMPSLFFCWLSDRTRLAAQLPSLCKPPRGFPHIFVMMSFRVAFFAALMAVVALVLQGCSDSTDDVVADSNTTTTTLEEKNESAAEGNATTTPVTDNNATTTVTTTVAEGNSTTTSQESTTTTSTTEAAAEEANATNTSNVTLLL